MKLHARALRTAALSLAGLASGLPAFAQAAAEEPSVTPYRPSVSTPAALSAPGYIEIEAGGMRVKDGAARSTSLPYTVKLAFTEDWGIRIGGDAWINDRDGTGQRIKGAGDTSIVLKRRFEIDDKSAWGLEGGVTLPTGKTGLSSEKTDFMINGIYSADMGAWHTDINLAATRFGQRTPGVSRTEVLWAASLSTALNDRWGVVGEFSGTRQSGVDATAQALVAVSYNVSKSLTLDLGVAKSIRSSSDAWSVFTGFTVLGGKLF